MVSIVSMRKNRGEDRYGGPPMPTQIDVVCSSIGVPSPKRALIICHPRAATADAMFSDPLWTRLYQDLSEKYVVSVSDLGGPLTWGNNLTSSAISGIKSMLETDWGTSGKIGLLGISMGGLAALNYAKSSPGSVAFVCGMVPALNLADLQTVSGGIYETEIDNAYGGNYEEGSEGPIYSPYVYRASYPASTVRTAFWYTEADDITRPQWVTAMQAAQPAIELYKVRNTSGVGPEHEDSVSPTIEGLSTTQYEFPKPADWCNQRLVDTAF